MNVGQFAAWLSTTDACGDARMWVSSFDPDADVMALLAAVEVDNDWLRWLIVELGLREQVAPLDAKYEADRAPLWAKYEAGRDALWAKYKIAVAPILVAALEPLAVQP